MARPIFEHPDFSERGWYRIKKAAEMLGISRRTVLRKAKLGRRGGGLDYKVGQDGYKKFLGKELLRFYNEA
jgi:transposase